MAIENGPVEIADFPNYKMMISSSQTVSLPYRFLWDSSHAINIQPPITARSVPLPGLTFRLPASGLIHHWLEKTIATVFFPLKM